jgi:SPP1 gp7 family putative phage head morphogenesis protein
VAKGDEPEEKLTMYQLDFDGTGTAVEHFQKPKADRSDYINIMDEVADRFKPKLKDLLRLRNYDEAVEKACTDRADDIIKPWFTLEPIGDEPLPDELLRIFDEWSSHLWQDPRNMARKSTIKQLLMNALDSTNWSGNGFVYKIYDDIDGSTQEGIKAISEEPSPSARIIGYQILPRERVTFDDSEEKTVFYNYNNMTSSSVARGDAVYLKIHPSRMIDLVLKEDPSGSWDGQSLITAAIVLMIAKMETGKEMHHMMARILPKQMVKFLAGSNDKDLEYVQNNLSGLVNRKAVTMPSSVDFDVKGFSGKLIDLDKMYDLFYQAIAIAADMPLDYLKGVSAGAVTGSNVNTFQYFKSINSDQTKIEPVLIADFLDYARRNFNFTVLETLRFNVIWGDIAPPDKDKESLQRLRHSQADRALLEAGLSLDAVNNDRMHFGLVPLEGEVAPEEPDTGQVEQTQHQYIKMPFMDTYATEDKYIFILESIFEDVGAEISKIGEASLINRVLHRRPKASDIDKIVDRHEEEIERAIFGMSEEAALAGAQVARADLGLALTRTFLDPVEIAFVETRGVTQAKLVTDTMKTDLRRVLSRGIKEGLGPKEIARNMKDIVNPKYRAERIARTETLTSSSFARHKGHKDLGATSKQWTTAEDELVRDAHTDVDGEVVPIDQKFSNGLMFPGDPNGPADQVINCRCAEAPVSGQTQHKHKKEEPKKKLETRIKQVGPNDFLVTEDLK